MFVICRWKHWQNTYTFFVFYKVNFLGGNMPKYSSQQCLLSPSQSKIGQRQRTDSPNRLTWLGTPTLLIIMVLVFIYMGQHYKRKLRERTEFVQHSVHRGAHIGGLSSQAVKGVWFGNFFSIMNTTCREGRGKMGDCSPRSTGVAEVSYLLQEGAGVRCRQQLTGSPQPDTGTEAAQKW